MSRESHDETLSRVESILRDLAPYANQNSTANLTVNAGGVGTWIAVWIASLCCTVCIVAMIFGTAWMLHQAKQIDDLNAYLQAIYQQAPSLQPPKEKSE